ncbi:hypothetical protein [Pseudonocardia sp. H11422]|uniref:hypothetical protein n=1 Tax=Pseudonocardia sp. H11422 TaxID=2835866 RepID=UPI001BDD94CC|nr:hypothetical protein [Pseudonocardia sp. H11422]
MLLLHGKATVAEVDGVLPEYASAQRKGMGDEASTAYLDAIGKPGLAQVASTRVVCDRPGDGRGVV